MSVYKEIKTGLEQAIAYEKQSITDNEIKKALENEIHLAEYVDSDYCSNVEVSLIKSTLDYINRLEAENKRLKEQHENFVSTNKVCGFVNNLLKEPEQRN